MDFYWFLPSSKGFTFDFLMSHSDARYRSEEISPTVFQKPWMTIIKPIATCFLQISGIEMSKDKKGINQQVADSNKSEAFIVLRRTFLGETHTFPKGGFMFRENFYISQFCSKWTSHPTRTISFQGRPKLPQNLWCLPCFKPKLFSGAKFEL